VRTNYTTSLIKKAIVIQQGTLVNNKPLF